MAPPARPAPAPTPAPSETEGVAGIPTHRHVSRIRDNVDALVVAFLLAMFIRTFVAELFMIPSPSMTPTLLGTELPRTSVGFVDVNADKTPDVLLRTVEGVPGGGVESYNVYLHDGQRYYYAGLGRPKSEAEAREWREQPRQYQDRIAVAKFLYWFSPPRRGDIVVFKVPESIYERDKPIFIKRATGLPGETLTFEQAPGVPGHEFTMGRLVANGEIVESPPFFQRQRYEYRVPTFRDGFAAVVKNEPLPRPTSTTYRDNLVGGRPVTEIAEVRVPEDGLFVMGDNTVGSQDSRYWGPVPLDRLRGRAIFRYNFRYFPFTKKPGFLN